MSVPVIMARAVPMRMIVRMVVTLRMGMRRRVIMRVIMGMVLVIVRMSLCHKRPIAPSPAQGIML
ncbi:hypothetical protein QBC99_005606 [Beijerinckia sp. GAS462]|nr:hypothetical protein [Beijerinckia sp. GAS462]SED52592.1 hypothetical protein SAMN05443249_5618 [Beijerinckia sp. 28-YEA-48]